MPVLYLIGLPCVGGAWQLRGFGNTSSVLVFTRAFSDFIALIAIDDDARFMAFIDFIALGGFLAAAALAAVAR